MITDLVADGLPFFRLLFRSRTSLSEEVLFLRKQLPFYVSDFGTTNRDAAASIADMARNSVVRGLKLGGVEVDFRTGADDLPAARFPAKY